MKPIFTDRPLTEAEKADLLAFFKSADIAERDTQQVAQLFGLAVAGMAIIALLTHLIWRRRLGSVRKRMVGTPRLTSSKSSDKTTLVLSAFMVIMAGSIASGLTVIVVTVI
jgi:hypothetical protein